MNLQYKTLIFVLMLMTSHLIGSAESCSANQINRMGSALRSFTEGINRRISTGDDADSGGGTGFLESIFVFFVGGSSMSTHESNNRRRSSRVQETLRINSPGERFTATHGISLLKGRSKDLVFVVDRDDVNYMAISANIAKGNSDGGPEKFEIFMKYGEPATDKNYDEKTTVSASDSYVNHILYSRDLSMSKPPKGNYFMKLVAKETFEDLLITAIQDFPTKSSEPVESNSIQEKVGQEDLGSEHLPFLENET